MESRDVFENDEGPELRRFFPHLNSDNQGRDDLLSDVRLTDSPSSNFTEGAGGVCTLASVGCSGCVGELERDFFRIKPNILGLEELAGTNSVCLGATADPEALASEVVSAGGMLSVL
jgi:hypothetical protein